jgi:hypothetical protein
MSPKNEAQLRDWAAELGEKLNKAGKVFSIRWVASSARTVKAVWNNYRPLVEHFMEASTEKFWASKGRSAKFVKNLAIVYDGLIKLSDVSLLFQKRHMKTTDADKTIKRNIRVLESMTTSPGPHAEEVTEERKYIQRH